MLRLFCALAAFSTCSVCTMHKNAFNALIVVGSMTAGGHGRLCALAQLSGWMGGLLGDGSAAPSKGPLDGGWLGPWIRWATQPTPRGGVPWTLDLPGPRIGAGGGGCFKVTLVLASVGTTAFFWHVGQKKQPQRTLRLGLGEARRSGGSWGRARDFIQRRGRVSQRNPN